MILQRPLHAGWVFGFGAALLLTMVLLDAVTWLLLKGIGIWGVNMQSLHRDYMPSAWQMYYPTVWDRAALVGIVGLFCALFFLFIRLLPMISIREVQELAHKTGHKEGSYHGESASKS